MSQVVDEVLGRWVELEVSHLAPPGAFLRLDRQPEGETVLLPRSEVPEGLAAGDALAVFVYLDSSDRPVATLQDPRLHLHEVTFLCVTDTTRFGAFVDWGLPKDLLIPFAEQTRELQQGDLEPIGLIRDRTGRLAGTMRIRELLADGGDFRVDEWVDGEAWRQEPGVGVFVIVERRFLALLPEHEPHRLRRGQAASFRVSHVWPDGRVELSLRGHGHEELSEDAERVLHVLQQSGAAPVSERDDPEQIRARFGLSRKAFKRAVGRLLKQGKVDVLRQGQVVVRAGRDSGEREER